MGTTQFPTVVRRWIFQKPRHPTPTGRISSGRDERPKSVAGEAPAEPPNAGPRCERLPAILRSSGDRRNPRGRDAAQQELRPPVTHPGRKSRPLGSRPMAPVRPLLALVIYQIFYTNPSLLSRVRSERARGYCLRSSAAAPHVTSAADSGSSASRSSTSSETADS